MMTDKIAIIGMSGLFPGSSTNDQFWENLMEEKDLIGMATTDDFGVDPQKFYEDGKGRVDRTYSLRGGYIRNFEFDPAGYALPESFLQKQDKLYQWSIYVAREALVHSGYYEKKDLLKKCGLILGNLSFPTKTSHQQLAALYTDTTQKALRDLLADPHFSIPPYEGEDMEGGILDYTPSRMVAEALELGGRHYALDAACATSLYAIKLACDELQLGRSDLMLAGAVCASDQLFIHMGFSIFHAYAPHGEKFVPLDKNSAGLVSSEGAGMVVLKRLEDARRDGDKILGVIGGIGLSNDGRGKFLLSPHPKGQRLAFERAYNEKEILPQNTSYLECHATGTPLGDVTELNSIADFFEQHKTQPLLGSVKSNMGHLLTAAGMTGLFKVLLAMEKEVIPPNINLEEGLHSKNGWIGKEQMILKARAWKVSQKQAGINSFGFGGTNAHMVVQNDPIKQAEETAEEITPKSTGMAIVGMDAHFGDCNSLDDFYRSIYYGKQHFRSLPKGRWKGFEENTPLLRQYGFDSGEAPRGAYIDNFEIDLLRYKIQPQEAETLEPQQALILKVADAAIKDAGLSESQNVAVLIAMESELAIHHYLARWDIGWQLNKALENSPVQLSEDAIKELEEQCKNSVYFRQGSQTPSQHTSFVGNIMASRIAALWDFNGPAFTVSSGQNSVFKALEIARNMLALGEVDAVVVGGVDFSGGLENVLLRNKKSKVNASDRPGLSWNKGETGWLIGEGAGAVVLKRPETTDDHKVYGIIGDTKSANSPAGDLDYVELADPSLLPSEVLKELDFAERKIAVGSIQSNFGNTFAASGIASLIKTALCLYHRTIPPVPNWQSPKDIFADQCRDFYFPATSRPWVQERPSDQEYLRRALILGDEKNHILLSEPLEQNNTDRQVAVDLLEQQLFLLKGNTEKELNQQLSALEIALQGPHSLRAIASQFFHISRERKTARCIALVAGSRQALQAEIDFFRRTLPVSFEKKQAIKTPGGSYFTPVPLGTQGKVAFVYPGSATAYPGLGSDLFQLFPRLWDQYASLKPHPGTYICPEYLYPKKTSIAEEAPDLYQDTIAMMSSGVFFSAAYTHVLRNIFQLEPQMAFGYSMGECSSMWYSTGVWSADETQEFRNSPIFKNRFAGDLELLAEHWNIKTTTAREKWVSLVLLAPKEKVLPLVDPHADVYLTFINAPGEVIISGDRQKCQSIADRLKCTALEVPFQNIIHHHFCEKEREGLLKMHQFPLQDQPKIDFYSSITGKVIPLDSRKIAENSTQVCVEQVDFPKTVQTVYKDDARIFIEVGANATCTGWIGQILKDSPHLSLSIDQKGKSSQQSIFQMLAQLSSHGIPLELSEIFTAPKENTSARRFLKKITPGGKRIYDTLLEEEFRLQFSSGKKVPIPVGALSGTEEYSLTEVTARDQSLNRTTDRFLTTQQQQSTSSMSSHITTEAKPEVTKTQTVGENGLLIQDFSTGDHLKNKKIIFSQADLEEFANGSIAKVFGEEYAVIDTYHRRVMLPKHPYLLVSRVTDLRGKVHEYKPSFMQTEYDIPHGAWFTTDRQIPWAVSVESGQCDLLLISYLGIDFHNKGNLVYRLLDCTLTFVDDLPFEGQTLRYDISINSFVRNGDNLLFFFSYRCYVEDRLVLKMDGGCAGFFTDEELDGGNGVVYTESELAVRKNAKKRHFTPLLQTAKTSFSKEDLRHLINGEMEKCFEDEGYFLNGRNPSLRLPPEKILMIDRITQVDIRGGAYGLGFIEAEKDLAPDDWYFPCHFRDDEVLAGSLQAEGGGNLLRFFMLYLGLQRLVKDARYQPVFDLPQKVRCRKQVVPGKDTKLIYRLEIKEIGLIPNPYVIGDLEIISNGVITVHFENLGLQLREKSNPKYLEKEAGIALPTRSEQALLNERDITTFALDDLSKCFGPEFSVYDGRTVSRQPNTDLQLISRIIKIDGERHNFKQPATIFAEYDVPVDAWYYQQNAAVTMPYSVLMEIALQPCGLLGAYLGSTLKFPDQNLYFRNLDGEGIMLDLPEGTGFRGKTICNKAVLASSVALGGTILQNYTFECSVDGQVFYKGKSSFGFFPGEALASQVGLDNGKDFPAWYQSEGLDSKKYIRINLDSLYGKMKLFKAPAGKPHYRLAEDQLNLLDQLLIAKDSGKHGKGYIHATKKVHKHDWFFTCHFYQDPVMPGSLGVEAILQSMQIFALQQDLGKSFKSPKFVHLPDHTTTWKYRGQILYKPAEMNLEVHIKSVTEKEGRMVIIGDAFLWNGNMRIYQVKDLALAIEEA